MPRRHEYFQCALSHNEQHKYSLTYVWGEANKVESGMVPEKKTHEI